MGTWSFGQKTFDQPVIILYAPLTQIIRKLLLESGAIIGFGCLVIEAKTISATCHCITPAHTKIRKI
jgi:hypothetical protein